MGRIDMAYVCLFHGMGVGLVYRGDLVCEELITGFGIWGWGFDFMYEVLLILCLE